MNSHRTSLGTRVTAAVCAALLIPSSVVSAAVAASTGAGRDDATHGRPAAKIPNDQLDSLVAPIALYPDPLLAQVLAASTYPLEIVQLQQWMAKHPDLKGEALAAAVEKENWDPAVQGLAALPDVVKRLGDDIKWTTDLGNAFLAQQSDVMDAVQRMRKKASDAGNLKTTEQQKVTTQVVETKEVIVIQQANPQVVYVPAYNPVVVYGPPIYPYPPIYYPPPGYYAAGVAIGFGVGIAMGAFWGGGGWGYGPRWGYGSVNINVNNRYVNHYNRNNIGNRYGGNWNHNPQHRGGAPYADRDTANRYGGTARGDSAATRQARPAARRLRNRRGEPAGANRAGASPGASSRGRATRGTRQRRRRRPRRQSQHPEQPGSSNRSGSAFGGASSSRPTSSAARSSSQRGSTQRGRVARALRRRRRATEVTGHDESTDDLDLGTIDGDAAHRRDGVRARRLGAPVTFSQTASTPKPAAGRSRPPRSRPPRPCRRRAPRHSPTAQAAADALIQAATTFDEPALVAMFGPDDKDLVSTEDPVRDKSYAARVCRAGQGRTHGRRESVKSQPGHAAGGPGPVAAARAARQGCGQVVFRRQGRTRRDPLPPRWRQ